MAWLARAQDVIPPSVPTNLAAVELDETSALLKWSASTDDLGVIGYEVFRDEVLLGTAASTNFTDAGPLDKYRSYEYTVRAYDNATNYSTLSSVAIFAYRRFPFVPPWDDISPGITDMSPWLFGPADTFLTSSNGHLYAGQNRVRFLGVNMVFSAAFPAHPDAEKLAARLAKLGVNCVRFHHLDTSLSPNGILRSLPSSDPLYKRALEPGQLDKLDYFIAQLKEHGIYANLNLHVGRTYPGFPTNGISSYCKGLDNYMPGMIALQKEYARDLLTHTNPYTGRVYASEPAVGLVEINNENGLIYEWHNGLFGPNLHSNYVNELSAQWNNWLSSRYTNDAALMAAWSPAVGEPYGNELLTNGDFAAGLVAPWNLLITAPASASQRLVPAAAPDGSSALELTTITTSQTDSDIQLVQTNLAGMAAGQSCTFSFWAKASAARPLRIALQQQAAGFPPLAGATIDLADYWQYHTLVLQATGTATRARLSMSGLAGQTGQVSLANFSLNTGNQLLGAASAAPEGASGSEMLTNGNFISTFASPWSLQVVSPAIATRQILTNTAPNGGNVLEINISQVSTSSWHVQFYHSGLRVTNGQPYRISFLARAEEERSISTGFQQQNSPWGGLGSANVDLSTNWQEYQVVVNASATENYTRLNMSGMGTQTGRVWFANISVRLGVPGIGLRPGETLGSISLIRKSDYVLRARAVQGDWMQFLWDTERAYWTGMRDYLKQELGVRALLIGTQTSYSPCLIQSELDVVDSHAYWQHPSFPHVAWDGNDWYVRNQSMAGLSSGSTIPGRAATRVRGKPFLCTEYNHPAPLTYATEALPLITSYAALQDWDGIFVFDYLSNTNWNAGYFNTYFSYGREPAKQVTFPMAAALLHRAAVAEARQEVSVSVPLEMAALRTGQTDAQLAASDFGVNSLLAFQHRMNVSTGSVAHVAVTWRDTNATALASDTGQLIWDTAQKLVIVKAPWLKGMIGNTRQQRFDLGDGVVITPGSTMQSNGWANLALLLKDGESFQSPDSHFLLVATGYSDNHRLRWRDGMGPTDPTSGIYATNWGKRPSLLEGIPAQVSLNLPAQRVRVWALDECGQPKMPVPVTDVSGQATFAIGRQYETAWYAISTASNEAPAIVFSATNRFSYSSLANLTLTPTVSDVDDNLASVEYYVGNRVIATVTNAPYTLNLPPLFPGVYAITAVARDTAGLATTTTVRVQVNNTPLTLLNAGSLWKYFDRTNDLGAAWRAAGYNDSTWSNGLARLGYGGDGEVTQVTSNRLRITTYFRQAFTVPEGFVFSNLTTRLQRDDGAVLYLNGQEILRSNMTNGAIVWGTLATNSVSGGEETRWFTNMVSAVSLRAGTNILAAEVHQANNNSSDLSFDLELSGQPSFLPPSLGIRYVQNGVLLSWPAGALGYELQVTTDLAQPLPWQALPAACSLSDGQWTTPLPITPNSTCLFRLAAP